MKHRMPWPSTLLGAAIVGYAIFAVVFPHSKPSPLEDKIDAADRQLFHQLANDGLRYQTSGDQVLLVTSTLKITGTPDAHLGLFSEYAMRIEAVHRDGGIIKSWSVRERTSCVPGDRLRPGVWLNENAFIHQANDAFLTSTRTTTISLAGLNDVKEIRLYREKVAREDGLLFVRVFRRVERSAVDVERMFVSGVLLDKAAPANAMGLDTLGELGRDDRRRYLSQKWQGLEPKTIEAEQKLKTLEVFRTNFRRSLALSDTSGFVLNATQAAVVNALGGRVGIQWRPITEKGTATVDVERTSVDSHGEIVRESTTHVLRSDDTTWVDLEEGLQTVALVNNGSDPEVFRFVVDPQFANHRVGHAGLFATLEDGLHPLLRDTILQYWVVTDHGDVAEFPLPAHRPDEYIRFEMRALWPSVEAIAHHPTRRVDIRFLDKQGQTLRRVLLEPSSWEISKFETAADIRWRWFLVSEAMQRIVLMPANTARVTVTGDGQTAIRVSHRLSSPDLGEPAYPTAPPGLRWRFAAGATSNWLPVPVEGDGEWMPIRAQARLEEDSAAMRLRGKRLQSTRLVSEPHLVFEQTRADDRPTGGYCRFSPTNAGEQRLSLPAAGDGGLLHVRLLKSPRAPLGERVGVVFDDVKQSAVRLITPVQSWKRVVDERIGRLALDGLPADTLALVEVADARPTAGRRCFRPFQTGRIPPGRTIRFLAPAPTEGARAFHLLTYSRHAPGELRIAIDGGVARRRADIFEKITLDERLTAPDWPASQERSALVLSTRHWLRRAENITVLLHDDLTPNAHTISVTNEGEHTVYVRSVHRGGFGAQKSSRWTRESR